MNETHERNVLMWLATRPVWAHAAFWAAIIGLLFLFGCNKITSSTDVDHPNEEAIKGYSQCYYDYAELEPRLGKLEVVFHEKARPVACPPNVEAGSDGMCHTAGWATPGSNMIHYVRPWVRDPKRTMWDLEWTSAHEVAHLTGIYLHNHELSDPLLDTRMTVDKWAWTATQAMKQRGGCGNQDQ
jgi:hypothetical protein